MSSDRPKRPELDRQQPIRSFDGILGAGKAAGSNEAPSPSDAKAGPDGVARGVDAGYRVIEEYMRQGEAFARTLWSPAVGNGAAADPQKLADRIYRYASDLAAAWLDYVQLTAIRNPLVPPPPESPSTTGPPGGFNVGVVKSEAEAIAPVATEQNGNGAIHKPTITNGILPPIVSVELVSKRRAEITVELKPGAAADKLTAYDLHARDSSVPRVSGIVVESTPADNRVLVRIALRDDQAPGLYTGLVVDDASNLPRGTITVRLHE
jgi:hypothetical protein